LFERVSYDRAFQLLSDRITQAEGLDQLERLKEWLGAVVKHLQQTGAPFELYVDGMILNHALTDLANGYRPPIFTTPEKSIGSNPVVIMEGRLKVELLALVEVQRRLLRQANVEASCDEVLTQCRRYLSARGVFLHQAFSGKAGKVRPSTAAPEDEHARWLEIWRGRILKWRKEVRRPVGHKDRPEWFTPAIEQRHRLLARMVDELEKLGHEPDMWRTVFNDFYQRTFEAISRCARS
jgi:hypothetical protein